MCSCCWGQASKTPASPGAWGIQGPGLKMGKDEDDGKAKKEESGKSLQGNGKVKGQACSCEVLED